MIGQAIARRVDLLGLLGLLLFALLWQLLTNVIPRFSLPTPLDVARRVGEDFILADYLVEKDVWLIGGDNPPVPAGTFDRSTDQHAIVADRGQFDSLAITAEPGPLGTEAPTGEIVATASL